MKTARPVRAWWLVAGLALTVLAVLGLQVTRETAPSVQSVAVTPACSSCDARHASFAALLTKQPEGTE